MRAPSPAVRQAVLDLIKAVRVWGMVDPDTGNIVHDRAMNDHNTFIQVDGICYHVSVRAMSEQEAFAALGVKQDA